MEKLTSFQKKTLRLYLQFRGSKLSVLRLLKFNWRIYVLFIGLAWIVIVITSSTPFIAYLFAAFMAGTFLRDIRGFHLASKNWPMICEIIDWNKAERLAQKSGVKPPSE